MWKETRHEYFWLSEEYFLQKNISWTTKWHFFCFLEDAFLSSLPSDLLRWRFSSSCFYPALWKPSLKLQVEQGMGQHERRHEIWPAAPIAKKTAVAEPLGKHSSRSTMLWAAREGPRLTVKQPGTRVCVEADLGRGHGAVGAEKGLGKRKFWQSSWDISSSR